MFINADREYREGRAQNFIDPEHIEKIVNAYDAFADVPGFAAVVENKKIIEDEAGNLNIRRYADSSSSPDLHDVRAHLHGGVPMKEIEALRASMLRPRASISPNRSMIAMPATPSLRAVSRNVRTSGPGSKRMPASLAGVKRWCKPSTLGGPQLGPRLADLPRSRQLMPLRHKLIDSFEPAMLPVGCVDRYALMGAIAGWWDEIRYELRVIVENDFAELVDGWVETLRSALEDDDADDDEDSDTKRTVKVTLEELLSHPFVHHRMADYVAELSAVAVRDRANQGRKGSVGGWRRRRRRGELAGGHRGSYQPRQVAGRSAQGTACRDA